MNETKIMNENATPRDRIADDRFKKEYAHVHAGNEGVFKKNVPLAMAYVPDEAFSDLYSTEDGFIRGTVFRDLDFPFLGKGGPLR